VPGDYVTLEVNGREADQAAVSLLETAHREIYGRELRPLAPKLDGITILVLRRQLTAARVGQAEEPVCVQDLGSYQGMILCNSCGWAPVGRVDDLIIPQDETFTGVIAAAIDGCPWDEI
jgi:hypothetical protein